MKKIGKTTQSLLLRTDFRDDKAWKALCSAFQRKLGQFCARITPMSDPSYDGATAKQLLRLVSAKVHPFFFVADRKALDDPEHPVLVIDVAEEAGRSFRVIPSEAWSVENNLSIANMGFEEFADSVDDDGVFRGFTDTTKKRAKGRDSDAKLAKMKPQDRAQILALRGDIEPAIRELLALRARQDKPASASLAEIAAYQGKWKNALQHAEVVLGSPSAWSTGNVYDDMLAIVAIAGRELRAWGEVRRIARVADKSLKEGRGNVLRGVRALAAFAKRSGKEPLFPWRTPAPSAEKDFQRKLEQMLREPKRYFTPSDRYDHLVAVARASDAYKGAVALYDAETRKLPSDFGVAVFLGSALARAGRQKEAWEVVRARLHLWWPVEDTQVAPMELLTDEGLAPLMTAERRTLVLRTPRGPEGPAG